MHAADKIKQWPQPLPPPEVPKPALRKRRRRKQAAAADDGLERLAAWGWAVILLFLVSLEVGPCSRR